MIAGAMLIARQTREAGKKLQEELVREWGAMPTTIMLRHSDATLSREEKARYHAILQERVPGIQIPDAQSEARDLVAADRSYKMATSWLNEQTRTNPIVGDENATYGFFRNLCALRSFGLLSAVIGVVGSTVLLISDKTPETLESPAVVSLALSIVCGLVMLFHATRAQVRKAGDDYAAAAIRAIDGTSRPR
jgi:hypothetical protein